MAPACETFPASALPTQVQLDVHGRRRKLDTDSASRKVDLSSCELLQMLQYKCNVEEPAVSGSVVTCLAVDRLFRRCKDKKGSFMVETTAWEDGAAGAAASAASAATNARAPDGTTKRIYQWCHNWNAPDTPS